MLGERIKKQRKLKGLTQKELAEKTGISMSAIEKYERGKLNPSLKKVETIANILDVSLCDLLPNENLEGLDIDESRFERFLEIHGQGFMYDKAPKELQDKFKNMYAQSSYIDILVQDKEVENIFTGDKQIASVFYDYISRKNVENERDITRIKEYYENLLQIKDEMINSSQNTIHDILDKLNINIK